MEEKTTPELVVAESSIKSRRDTPSRPRPGDFQLSCACYATTTCGTHIRAFGDVLRARPGDRDGIRCGGEMKPPPPGTDDDSSVSPTIVSTSHTNAPLLVFEAADIHVTAGYKLVGVPAHSRACEMQNFIEGSMNFERNIVNPSAR